jgi:kynurenine formamidase
MGAREREEIRMKPVVRSLACAIAACVALAGLLPLSAAAEALNIHTQRVVDLTHAFDDKTVAWPTEKRGYELERLSHGKTEGGWFYSANRISTPEHAGTHLDAPVHFGEGKAAASDVPLSRLIGRAVVIDVTAAVLHDRDYLLSRDDVEAWERKYREIPAGSIVLLRTGIDRFWGNPLLYLGDDRPGKTDRLSFPSFGIDAARYLVKERKVAALGVDSASVDGGKSKDFPVHRLLAEHDLPAFENLANLAAIPPWTATIVALPMKIAGGSGGPLRAIAFVPR